MQPHPTLHILYAEDDPDDQMLARDALAETGAAFQIEFVEDGEELIHYLSCNAIDRAIHLPDLIFLDLNMPKKDGREALREIRKNKHLKHIPIVVMSTSNTPEDIYETYRQGVNSYIHKPSSYNCLVDNMKTIIRYWHEVALIPREQGDLPANAR